MKNFFLVPDGAILPNFAIFRSDDLKNVVPTQPFYRDTKRYYLKSNKNFEGIVSIDNFGDLQLPTYDHYPSDSPMKRFSKLVR